jgi:hypothetical protein
MLTTEYFASASSLLAGFSHRDFLSSNALASSVAVATLQKVKAIAAAAHKKHCSSSSGMN